MGPGRPGPRHFLDTSCCPIYTWDNWSWSSWRLAALRRMGFRGGQTVAPGETVVTKKEIVKTISDEIGLTQLKTKEIVQKTFDAIVETLVTEGRIELRNFGVFEVKKRAARRARNPRTGDKVSVPEKYVVTFKPGKEMEEKVKRMSEIPDEIPPSPPVDPPSSDASVDSLAPPNYGTDPMGHRPN